SAASCSSSQADVPKATCDRKKVIHETHCAEYAFQSYPLLSQLLTILSLRNRFFTSTLYPTQISSLLKIIYEADGNLDPLEIHVERIFGNCVVMLDKPFNLKVPKKEVQDGFSKIFAQCHNLSGRFEPKTGVVFRTRPRVIGTLEDDTPFGQPIKIAWLPSTKSIPNAQNIVVHNDGQASNVEHASVGTCDVGVFTSDMSAITVAKKDLLGPLKLMLSTCKGQWSGVSLQKGVTGRNGRLIMRAASTKDNF
ncbi:hypothetical protein PSTT_11893, partial [Puccinia striiformis]